MDTIWNLLQIQNRDLFGGFELLIKNQKLNETICMAVTASS
jgi:hypothetical protein